MTNNFPPFSTQKVGKVLPSGPGDFKGSNINPKSHGPAESVYNKYTIKDSAYLIVFAIINQLAEREHFSYASRKKRREMLPSGFEPESSAIPCFIRDTERPR